MSADDFAKVAAADIDAKKAFAAAMPVHGFNLDMYEALKGEGIENEALASTRGTGARRQAPSRGQVVATLRHKPFGLVL
jgi:hypothetical protein